MCPGKEGDRAGMSDRSATLADLAALENVEPDIGASSKALLLYARVRLDE